MVQQLMLEDPMVKVKADPGRCWAGHYHPEAKRLLEDTGRNVPLRLKNPGDRKQSRELLVRVADSLRQGSREAPEELQRDFGPELEMVLERLVLDLEKLGIFVSDRAR